MSVPRVVVGGLTHGAPRAEYVGSIMRLWDYETRKSPEFRHWHSYHLHVGPYISRNRNYLTRLFLAIEDRPEWLLMIDHDVVVPPTIMEDLVREAGDEAGVVIADHVLGTSCPTTALMAHPEDQTMFFAAQPPGEGTHKHFVEAIASSVVMVHRRVYGAIAEKFGRGTWWMLEHLQDKDGYWDELGEDFSFSKRALAVGERLMAVYGLDIQHYKVGLVMGRPKT